MKTRAAITITVEVAMPKGSTIDLCADTKEVVLANVLPKLEAMGRWFETTFDLPVGVATVVRVAPAKLL